MKLKEYQNALNQFGYQVVQNPDVAYILHILDQQGRQIFAVNVKNACIITTGCLVTSEAEYEPVNTVDATVMVALCQATDDYLQTPGIIDELGPVYQLVWSKNELGFWLVGYDPKRHHWQIGHPLELRHKGLQTQFTNDELLDLTEGDDDLYHRLSAMKEQAN